MRDAFVERRLRAGGTRASNGCSVAAFSASSRLNARARSACSTGRYSGVAGAVPPAPPVLDVLTVRGAAISNARPSVVSERVALRDDRAQPVRSRRQRLDEHRLAEDDALVADELSLNVGAQNRRTALLGRHFEPHAERGGSRARTLRGIREPCRS